MRWSDEARPVEVVLDEEPGDGDAEAGPEGARRAGTAPGSRRVPRWPWVAGAVTAVIAALGAVDAVAERRERAAFAAVAHVPGVVGSLAAPLGEQWRLPTRSALTGVRGRVVTVDEGALVGLDSGTGDRRWTIPLPDGDAVCPIAVPRGDGPGRLVCAGLVDAGTAGVDGVVAHVVEAADGEVVTDLSVPPQLLAAAALEQDLVLVGSRPGGLAVSRLGLTDGRPRWTAVLSDLPPAARDVRLHGDPAVVVLEGATTVVLDARDGRELGRWIAAADAPTSSRPRVVSHPGTGFGVWVSRSSGRWYAPDGTPGAALHGDPVTPRLDDGSTPGTVLLADSTGDRLRAVDVATGDVRWDRPAPAEVLLRVAGRLVVTGDGRLDAWDAATGEVEWSVDLDDGDLPTTGGPYTDGVRVLVPGQDGDALRLTALRLDDGREVWRTTLPTGSEYVRVLGDRLVAIGRLDGDRVVRAAVLG